MDGEVACAIIIQLKLSLCSGHLGSESRVSGTGLQILVSENTKMAENKLAGVHAT